MVIAKKWWWIVFAALVALITLISLPWHKSLFVAFIVCVVFAFVSIVLFQNRLGEAGRHSFEVSAALISSFAILSTGYWFVFERPGVPKIDVESRSEIYPLSGKRALVRIEVEARNVGSTAVKFSKDALAYIHIGQIVPIPSEALESYRNALRDEGDEQGLPIENADDWPALAEKRVELETMIEAGESERYYYKAIVPCAKNMALSVTVRIPKNRGFLDRTFGDSSAIYYWIDQSATRLDRPCLS